MRAAGLCKQESRAVPAFFETGLPGLCLRRWPGKRTIGSAVDAIRIDQLSKSFGRVRALDEVSLRIDPGELFFLLGASGCGKSTLLRCIAGLEQPDSGRIRFGNEDVGGLPPHRREAAMVFQSYALWPHLSVAQNIAFGLEERAIPAAEIRRRVAEALAMVKLDGFGPRSIDQMSGGQQQRVALARALVVRPKCLLLDEPLSNLDAQLRVEMRHEIRRIVKQHGLTGVYVTHDQEEALSMADRMAIMDRGRIEQTGTPEEIYRHPRSARVAAFIGDTNLIEGQVLETRSRHSMVMTAGGALVGRVTDPDWDPPPGEQVVLSIRPEAWCIGGAARENILPARVVERVYLGQRIQYWLDTPAGRQQVIDVNPRVIHEAGTCLEINCRHDDGVVLRAVGLGSEEPTHR